MPEGQEGTSSVASAQFMALQQAADVLSEFDAQAAPPVESLSSETGDSGLPAFVSEIARSAPRIFLGEDRLRYYAEQVDKVDDAQREALRDYLDGFVHQLHTLSASDMDLGGPACVGRVWYRVDGEKTPHTEVGARSNDEVDILILNLLSPRQRTDLFDVQSSDFSYFLNVGSGAPVMCLSMVLAVANQR